MAYLTFSDLTSPVLWTLIGLQIAMGGFDTLFHHEMTERLAWRPSQQLELRLHGARNLIYALLFLALGWTRPQGLWAMTVIALLLVEAVITLIDFVEEDRSRALPASERVTHTLLALNYGAILALLLPVLIGWAADATALPADSHGWWSILCSISAAGVVVSGLRDIAAARRAPRLARAPAGELMSVVGERKTVLVTGATGFIGSRLVAALALGGHRVIALVRVPAKAAALTPPFTMITSLDQIAGDCRIDVIVNLAGEPIASLPWTEARKRRMVESRLAVTHQVLALIERLDRHPALLINGSAIGWYGLRGDEALDEASATGAPCFSNWLCAAWEQAASDASRFGVRVVLLRIGLVLGSEGGMLARLLTPFEFGAGGPLGSGRQWMSWIERDDLVRLIAHVIASPGLAGPLNATAPTPVTNAGFSAALGKALHRPSFLRVPAMLLRPLGGFADELLLGGQRVLPAKAIASGFRFRHGDLASALAYILGGPSAPPPERAIEKDQPQYSENDDQIVAGIQPAGGVPEPGDESLPERPHGQTLVIRFPGARAKGAGMADPCLF